VVTNGTGLFKFDPDIKAYQGDTLELRHNPNNRQGKWDISHQIICIPSLMYLISYVGYKEVVIHVDIIIKDKTAEYFISIVILSRLMHFFCKDR
jgi:hypothetical protein